MALNKAQTSVGVKVILVLLIVAFVASFIPLFGSAFSGDGGAGSQQNKPSTLESIAQQFQPTVASLTAQLQSEPESYPVLVSLGNTYFDWAIQVQQASSTDSATIGADQLMWVAAKDAYRRALAVREGEAPVTVDYAITLFYTGETNEAIKTALKVTKDTPDFGPAYFNLGVFYNAVGQTGKAIAAYEQYLKLDPEGARGGDPAFAKSEIERLRGIAGTSTLTTGTP